jgi:hypothetical protein
VIERPNDEMGMQIVCRRLAGQTVGKVSAFLRKICRPLRKGETSCEWDGSGRAVCYYYRDYERWVKVIPPFQIDFTSNQEKSMR